MDILGFNSSVGILVVRTMDPGDHVALAKLLVSIPRSEFWSFGPMTLPWALLLLASFNSSVGILVVRTTFFTK